ncbi:MFS transporter [Leucobacter chromiireducens]
MTDAAARPRNWGLLFVAVCLLAANMRMTITGVGPLLEQIAADRGVAPAALGGLASVPLIAWSLVSPLAHGLSLRFGLSRTISWSLVALTAGTVWRSLPGSELNLWFGTALIGAALAIGNVLLPVVIRRDFSARVPTVMGIYTALLGGIGALAAGLVVPISHVETSTGELGWRIALLTSGALIPVALVAWLSATRGEPAPQRYEALPLTSSMRGTTNDRVGRRIWRDPVAWTVAVYQGSQAMLFYMIATWLAPIQVSQGSSAVDAGLDVMFYQLVSILGSLCLPLMFRGTQERWLPAVIPILIAGTFACVVLIPGPGLHWVLLGGFASGASLSLSMLYMAIRAQSSEAASALSGMAQSIGYLIAAAGPALFGWLAASSGGWILPLWLVLAVGAVQLVAGILLGRGRMVFEARP